MLVNTLFKLPIEKVFFPSFQYTILLLLNNNQKFRIKSFKFDYLTVKSSSFYVIKENEIIHDLVWKIYVWDLIILGHWVNVSWESSRITNVWLQLFHNKTNYFLFLYSGYVKRVTSLWLFRKYDIKNTPVNVSQKFERIFQMYFSY